MKKTTITIFLVSIMLISIAALGQTGQLTSLSLYNASTISKEMKDEAYSVKRDEKIEIEVKEPGRASFKSHEVITILNKKHANRLGFVIHTNSFKVLEDGDIRLYDSVGRLISKHKKKDLMTSTTGGDGLIEDFKIYYLQISTASYPVTLETDYEVTYKGLLHLPRYAIQDPSQSVERSSFNIKFLPDIAIKYKVYNIDLKAADANTDKFKGYAFTVSNLRAKKYEENSGPQKTYFPYVKFNAAKFEFGGYSGNMSTWKDFGFWYFNASSKLNQLSEKNKKDVQALVAGVNNDKEKVKILYSYLQKNFRYVSIQLGVGGWIPFPADFLHEKKYGDCKGLSNYMQACLSAINIKSYQALINRGSEDIPVDPDFAYSDFNHMVLCVPLPKDTIWLECTSNDIPFGNLGMSNENRNALLVTEKGGVLTPTQKSNPISNQFSMKTNVAIKDDGSGEINANQITTGEFRDYQIYFSKEKKDDQKRFLVDWLGFTNPDDYEINFDTPDKSPYETKLYLLTEKISDFTAGSKMFIRPRMYRFWGHKMPAVEKRTQDFLLDFPLVKLDTTVFALPEGFNVEALPTARKVEFEFGKYESKYWVDAQTKQVYSTANLVLNQYRIPADKYNATKAFMDKILEDENQKLVIRKQ